MQCPVCKLGVLNMPADPMYFFFSGDERHFTIFSHSSTPQVITIFLIFTVKYIPNLASRAKSVFSLFSLTYLGKDMEVNRLKIITDK